MKRMMFMTLVIALLAFPTAPLLAQPGDGMPTECSPDVFLSELSTRLEFAETPEDFSAVFMYGVEMVSLCWEYWAMMLMEALSEMLPPGLIPPTSFDTPATVPAVPRDPNDGVLTAEEAEYALTSAFSGDVIAANEFLCPASQLTEEDLAGIPGDFVIERIKCAAVEDTMTCAYNISLSGESFAEEVTFDVVDGKLCEIN